MKQRLLLILSLLSIRVLSPVRDQLDHYFLSVLSVPIGEIRGSSRTAGLKPPTRLPEKPSRRTKKLIVSSTIN